MALQASPGAGRCQEYHHQASGTAVSNAKSQASCFGLVRMISSSTSRQDFHMPLCWAALLPEYFHGMHCLAWHTAMQPSGSHRLSQTKPGAGLFDAVCDNHRHLHVLYTVSRKCMICSGQISIYVDCSICSHLPYTAESFTTVRIDFRSTCAIVGEQAILQTSMDKVAILLCT